VSIVENANILRHGAFSAAPIKRGRTRQEWDYPTLAGRDWDYSRKFGHTNSFDPFSVFENPKAVIHRTVRISVEVALRDWNLRVSIIRPKSSGSVLKASFTVVILIQNVRLHTLVRSLKIAKITNVAIVAV
jgi:hypothetical protein